MGKIHRRNRRTAVVISAPPSKSPHRRNRRTAHRNRCPTVEIAAPPVAIAVPPSKSPHHRRNRRTARCNCRPTVEIAAPPIVLVVFVIGGVLVFGVFPTYLSTFSR
jgi:hypothetical protein